MATSLMILFIWRCLLLNFRLSSQVNVVPRPAQLQPAISAQAEFVYCDQAIDDRQIRMYPHRVKAVLTTGL